MSSWFVLVCTIDLPKYTPEVTKLSRGNLGFWSYPKLVSQPLNFVVAADPSVHGFVRINQQNPRYLAFDDGSFYLPIGLNLGWASQPNLGVLRDYQRWLDRLSQNGGNVGRVWMASWSFGIEWNDTGLGNYSGRMKRAWLLD